MTLRPMLRLLPGLLLASLMSVPLHAEVLLEETVVPKAEQEKAHGIRDGLTAPRSVLGDVGHGMAKTMSEGLDSSSVRGQTIRSTLDVPFRGKCLRNGYHEMGKYDVSFSNGATGTVTVRCNRGCWEVSVYPGMESASNCGVFEQDSWAGPRGRWLNDYGAKLKDVANFIVQ
ncbi:hypothetical protein [Azospirillum himalayense]|uniref:Uncharacterized protein n=1 Tax=Azospirillum himalayense TaxID=654847 RepID=A0ABW0G3X9_9PROT